MNHIFSDHMNTIAAAPLVVHLIYRLDFGGLETLVVECINRMPAAKYRHAIICLTDYSDFAKKIQRPDVEIYALHKPAGLGLSIHLKLWTLLRRLRPAILHTYNLGTIEYAVTALLAGVPIRTHAEHGREASDPDGKNRKHNLLRRLLVPFIDCFIPVSADLAKWLQHTIGVPDEKKLLIHNGVDTDRFKPAASRSLLTQMTGWPASCFVIGTVGRIQDVKNHACLVDAFIQLQQMLPAQKHLLRLVIIGDGPLLPALKNKIAEAGIADEVWLPGARTDIAAIMQTFSVFALSSIAEGTPVTILEAMATSLPVVATKVGGIPEVVVDNHTGQLVPASDPEKLANALALYVQHPQLAAQHGTAGRARVEQNNSIAAMVLSYIRLYDSLRMTKAKILSTD